jgi:ribosomal subunit interface protein
MNIAVKGVSVKENRALENYALEKAEKFYHIFPEIVKVEIELKTEVGRRGKEEDFIADLTLHIPHKTLKLSDSERDLYKAIDKAVERMLEILRREKGKKDGRLQLKMNKKKPGSQEATIL